MRPAGSVGVGVKINMPMIGPGDYFSAQFNYTEGAAGYVDDGATNGGIIATGGPGGYYSNLTATGVRLRRRQRWRLRRPLRHVAVSS